jgi:hypothetical protein
MSKYISNWFPAYIKERSCALWSGISRNHFDCVKHIMFLFVDHYELAGKAPRLAEWLEKYPVMASRHRDSDGMPPRHTWFYAMDLMREEELAKLRKMVEAGLGEIELHWHHHHDNAESFMQKLEAGLRVFQKYDFMRARKNESLGTFGFIHGDWSLANSLGDRYCGVGNEIELLIQAGCYGDFTFPALFSKAQPAKINSIYYASGRARGRSYDKGRASRVGERPYDNELMMFQGPLTINWRDWRFKWHPLIEDGEIGRSNSHGDAKRIDCWVSQGIAVEGRPEWIFVKVFCHGGQDYASVLGTATDKMHGYLEGRYNDGIHYKLHYVTAREAFNIVKAAEDGKVGNPNEYRDYVIKPPFSR